MRVVRVYRLEQAGIHLHKLLRHNLIGCHSISCFGRRASVDRDTYIEPSNSAMMEIGVLI